MPHPGSSRFALTKPLGGLHYGFPKIDENDYRCGDPYNDLEGLPSNTLGAFLLSVRNEMSELLQLSAAYAGEGISEDRENETGYYRSEVDNCRLEEEQIISDLYDDSEEYHLSNEDGWFYKE